ncbi:hypothetical protein [Hymenobacter sp. DG01]|uniref:hypothetical protein n=1 Tax=Hymenobacter sp. DG01 TaxID=2584940 RepID=UPI001120FC48|nr:hypothetical protein [Hymenobacter sp. DG01]
MDPRTNPAPPNPAEPTLPAKGTPDTQSSDADKGTNLPRPESTPAAPDTEEKASAAPTEPDHEMPADATASTTGPDGGAGADPGASNTSNDEPL